MEYIIKQPLILFDLTSLSHILNKDEAALNQTNKGNESAKPSLVNSVDNSTECLNQDILFVPKEFYDNSVI